MVCKTCKEDKPIEEFYAAYQRKDGSNQYYKDCKDCYMKRQAKTISKTKPAHVERSIKRRQAKHSRMRREGIDVPRWILEDSTRSDRKCGLTNDLTKANIAALIANGCLYCGETGLRMTLDRIDNAGSHSTVNVNPACIRCNLIRRDMPYEIWAHLVPTIRSMRESGIFGTWSPRRKKTSFDGLPSNG